MDQSLSTKSNGKVQLWRAGVLHPLAPCELAIGVGGLKYTVLGCVVAHGGPKSFEPKTVFKLKSFIYLNLIKDFFFYLISILQIYF